MSISRDLPRHPRAFLLESSLLSYRVLTGFIGSTAWKEGNSHFLLDRISIDYIKEQFSAQSRPQITLDV